MKSSQLFHEHAITHISERSFVDFSLGGLIDVKMNWARKQPVVFPDDPQCNQNFGYRLD